jgi:biotin transport system substrate-specific component
MTLYRAIAERRANPSLVTEFATIIAASLLMTIAAKVEIPFYPVPMTMQTLVAIGLGLALGPVRGGVAVLLYLAEGAAGFPVFAGTPEKGIGLAYLIGPTGGYLVGFAAQAVVAGWFATRGWDRNPPAAMAAALIAGAVIYVPGLLWLGSLIGFDKPILSLGLYPFIPADIVKALLAAMIFPTAWRLVAPTGPR